MFKKSLGVFVALIVVFGMTLFCNKDNNPVTTKPAVDVTGVWSGIAAVYMQGAFTNDTFSCVLKITNNGYSLLRGHVFYGSSGVLTDSSREVGTWVKTGDTLVLNPNTATDSCFYFDGQALQWIQCDGTLNAQFRTCNPPDTLKIDITGKTWTVGIPRYDDITSIQYTLTKP